MKKCFQLRFILIASFFFKNELHAQCDCDTLRDRRALIEFYNATNVDWNLNQAMQTWQGVQVNAQGCVEEFSVVSPIIQGEIPPAVFKDLKCLKSLRLGNIYPNPGIFDSVFVAIIYGLSTTIPPEIAQLTLLEDLQLSLVNINGEIPASIALLTHLKTLALDGNILSKAMPDVLDRLPALEFLNLSRISSVPASIERLTNLKGLRLFESELTSLPSYIRNLVSLERLDLGSNKISGAVLADIFQLTRLKELYLSDNQIMGNIPSSIGALQQLEILDLRNNQVTGTLPASITQLTNLKELLLSDNQLTGELPAGFEKLSRLKKLELQNNQLTGAIPLAINNLDTVINLESNNFTALPKLTGSSRLKLKVTNNRLSFDDILPNLSYLDGYIPQKNIAIDSYYIFSICETPVLDLKVDQSIPNNRYVWYKGNDSLTITNRGVLNLGATFKDLPQYNGIYKGTITNPSLPGLTLQFDNIWVQTSNRTQAEDTIFYQDTICVGESILVAGVEYNCLKPFRTEQVQDTAGCLRTYQVALHCQNCLEQQKTNTAFTPNGDGINDHFILLPLLQQPEVFVANELQVFNRFRELVYQEKNYSNNWRGVDAQGISLPAGTYYYIFKYQKGTPLTGIVTIIR